MTRLMIRGRKVSPWIGRLIVTPRGLVEYLALAILALALWFSSPLILSTFPLALRVGSDGTTLEISVDGSTHELELEAALQSARFSPQEPYYREYQIDGSDTTNNFNFDPAHFSTIGETPYYRLQSFLRDESSFSQWRGLTVTNRTSSEEAHWGDPYPGREYPLPGSFLVTVQLHRLEAPRTVEFIDEKGAVIAATIDRNDKYIQIIKTAPGDFPQELALWYFPKDWLPHAANLLHMLMRTVAIGLGFLLVLVPVAALIPWRPGWDLRGLKRLFSLTPYLASIAVLVAGTFSAVVLFDRAPHILDAISYYFQGKILASGALAAPAPPVNDAFPTPFTVVHEGKWFSQYPPGGPLLLAIGFLFGVPWLVQPLLAAVSVLLLYDAARRQYGWITASLAVALMACSPFLPLMSGSFLSHVPALFFATCFLYAATRYLESPSAKLLIASAISLGGIFLCREVAALLYGLPIGAYMITVILGRGKDGLRDCLAALISLGLVAMLYLAYNWAQTGNPLLLPRLLYYGGDRFGFGEGVGFYGQHTPAAGLVNTDELLTSLSFSLFGWPFYTSLAMMSLPFLFRRAYLWDRLHGVVLGLTVLVYFCYFYHGIALGPRYYFDALPSLLLLTARGFSVLASAASSMLLAIGIRKDVQQRATIASLLLCAILMVPNFLYYTPRQVELYRGFTGLPGGRGPALGGFVRTELSGRKPVLERALVTTTDWWIYTVYLAAMNDPKLDGDTVFALLPSGEDRAALMTAFSGREWYRLIRDDQDRLAVEWVGRIP